MITLARYFVLRRRSGRARSLSAVRSTRVINFELAECKILGNLLKQVFRAKGLPYLSLSRAKVPEIYVDERGIGSAALLRLP